MPSISRLDRMGLEEEIANLIIAASEEVIDGFLDDHFSLRIW